MAYQEKGNWKKEREKEKKKRKGLSDRLTYSTLILCSELNG